MTLLEQEKKELESYGFPKYVLQLLVDLINVEVYLKHIKAKNNLIAKGEKILPVMNKLLKSESKIIRKEAMKVIESIAHYSSIPKAITMLDDIEAEIRWIAAETLVRIGRSSIKPLLKALIQDSESYYLRQGAHHVLSRLVNDKDVKELKQLVKLTRHDADIHESIPVTAANILDMFTIYNS